MSVGLRPAAGRAVGRISDRTVNQERIIIYLFSPHILLRLSHSCKRRNACQSSVVSTFASAAETVAANSLLRRLPIENWLRSRCFP